MSPSATDQQNNTATAQWSTTLRDALDASVQKRPDVPALAYFDRTFTFIEVAAYAKSFGAWLQDQGVKISDRVMVQLQNVPQFIFAAIGCWEIGAVAVPVSPMYRSGEISRIAKDSGAKIWVTSPNVWQEQGEAAIEGTQIEHVVTTEMNDMAPGSLETPKNQEAAKGPLPAVLPTTALLDIFETMSGKAPERSPLAPSDMALFTYTSGTTGPPKAAITSHENLCYVGYTYADDNGLANTDQVIFAMAPLVHITGLAMHISSWLTTSCMMIVAYRFHPEITVQQIIKYGATWTTGTATAYQAILQTDPDQLKQINTLDFTGAGGSPVSAAVTRQVFDTLSVQLQPGYGLTEVTAAITTTMDRHVPRIDENSGVVSVGKPLTGSEVMIIDANDNPLPAFNEGELITRGPGAVQGYWQLENDGTFMEEGWVRTGDIGFLDEEGWLYIIDRSKNLIVASGYKVWPREVEDVLYEHPAIHEVSVVGAPDEYRGETVVAFVSLRKDATATEQELIDFCREKIAAYKVPSRIAMKSELPKNFNGKIQVRELKAAAARNESL